jgi:hypothetical protein
MKSDKTLVFSCYSDAHEYYIYIYLKGYGKFILEDKLKERGMRVRINHWEEVLDKVHQGLMVETREEALRREPDPVVLKTA